MRAFRSNRGFKMRKILGFAFSLFALPVLAADLPPITKAPNFLTYPGYTGQGFYWGIGAEAGVEQTKINGNPLFVNSLANGSLMAAGGTIGGTIGFMKGMGTSWIACEASGQWQNISSSAGVVATVSNRWSADQACKFGGFQQVLSQLPTFGINFPALPNIPAPPGFNIAANTSHPYVLLGVREFGMGANLGVSNGSTVGIAPEVGAGVLNQLLDKDGKISGTVLDTYAKVVFANQGKTLTFNNSSPAVGGSAKIGTQYFAGVKVLW